MSTAPNFSPIATLQRKFPGSGSSRKHAQPATLDNNKPKYQCPGCKELFAKWSPCLAHLRDKQHAPAELLDKKLNGGDFRKVQEMCATLAYHQRGGGAGRDRTDSSSSVDSLSSDSGGEEDDSVNSSQTPSGTFRRGSPGLKQKFVHTASTLPQVSSRPSSRNWETPKKVDLRKLEEKLIFRILTFLDVDSSRILVMAMTRPLKQSTHHASESRVRLWSVSSDPDSLSLPSSSPQTINHKRIASPLARFEAT